ncbi:MAG: bifunctional proline dehydrogenase/L-glutamate gamma-semialdehyde dehydrogenase PutA [Gammaproteobacteria bacterium]|nr:bifunctional proline dehydrogenase/L-glutamate gamma-semialdehyde dehydrogenase PutA [Gammaproteobacteria bacterium]
MHFTEPPGYDDPLRDAVAAQYRADETATVNTLLEHIALTPQARHRIAVQAHKLVEAIRGERRAHGGLDAFLHEFDLSSREGVVLMCLAEALLRVPDAVTADRLIKDKLGTADWEAHLGHSDSLFVNASTWALMLTGRLVQLDDEAQRDLGGFMRRMVARSGEPVIRAAIGQAMRILGGQFVLAEDIDGALNKARIQEQKGYCYSYDMLGEAAHTMADAQRYLGAYMHAIETIGQTAHADQVMHNPEISVKLSALHPRYEFASMQRVMDELLPCVKRLALAAKRCNIGLTIDAEEADRLDPSLSILEALAGDTELADWHGLGLAVQAYQKRALYVVDWLAGVARRTRRRFMVRLVKGAYWDAEIKRTQELGLADYPVFTRKANTDVSYLACAQKLLADPTAFYTQFATHNAHTAAAVSVMAGETPFEFQCLHGMGEALYAKIVEDSEKPVACRIYAPVGEYKDLLAYLVRRLLENGANTSFVNRLVDEKLPIEEIVADPVTKVRRETRTRHPSIPLPADLYGPERRNSSGIDISDAHRLRHLAREIKSIGATWQARPLLEHGTGRGGSARDVTSPGDRTRTIGRVIEAGESDVEAALASANEFAPSWDATAAGQRAAALRMGADLYEEHSAELLAICQSEGGKTLNDAVAEVREAVDFLRYYALQAERDFGGPQVLPGPTGERNEISLHGRGPFVCISPWNFPLAIFTGQLSAALAAGNVVLAKPAEQTPLLAAFAVDLLHKAGVPRAALQLLPGRGETVGAALVRDVRVRGVAFTGSTETARIIAMGLAKRGGPIVPLIAETGGQNAMLVDSTALPEQVVRDVIVSAFQSAGQRCSALRVLYLQDDTADIVIEMLAGAMQELVTGDPEDLATDVGPIIDEEACATLEQHVARMRSAAHRVINAPPSTGAAGGYYFPPVALQIDSISQLPREVFGPVLHIIRYPASDFDAVLDDINATGYGLTLGVHSRIDTTVERVRARARVGNLYANRSMIGAVVGVQPFGGEGLSGTGPKAGGPRYLHRFATERAISTDTTAAGGNASLMSLQDDV